MDSKESLIGRRFSIRGRVQGVGFRDYVQHEARQLRLTGYVRNLPDGSVLVCAVGPEPAVTKLESALRQGARTAEVSDVSIEEMAADQSFHDFRIVF